jgi:PleD family two-component response regulator
MMAHTNRSPISIPRNTGKERSAASNVQYPKVEHPTGSGSRSACLQATKGHANVNGLSRADSPQAEMSESTKALKELVGTVLVIDDSDIARASMVNVLAQAGLDVLELASPIGATRAIIVNNVSVVVVDILMPGMRGDRLAALFRGNPRFKSLGVVLVSGERGVELDQLLTESGADAAVSKMQLHDLVSAVVGVRRKRSAHRA